MQTSIKSHSGLTLMELMVAMAIGAMIYLGAASGILVSNEESVRIAHREALEEFEIEQRVQIGDTIKLYSLIAQSQDSLLKSCMSTPCLRKCREQISWKPLKWGSIELAMATDSKGKRANIGSSFDSSRKWKKCATKVGASGQPEFPFFSNDCQGRARAFWRASSVGFVEFKVIAEVPAHRLKRRILHRVLLPRDPLTGTCQLAAGNSCGYGSVLLTGTNLKEGKVRCRDFTLPGRIQ